MGRGLGTDSGVFMGDFELVLMEMASASITRSILPEPKPLGRIFNGQWGVIGGFL